MSGMFLTRRLRLWQHLESEHLPKEGLRYWFANGAVSATPKPARRAASSARTVPSFQLRRDALDEHVLASAVAAGAELRRPARVRDVELGVLRSPGHLRGGRPSRDGALPLGARRHRSRDASRQEARPDRAQPGPPHRGDLVPVEERAAHRRPRRARTLDFAARNVSSRRLATNHYMGYGYWTWFIPLGNGETSIGVVFDKRLLKLHEQPDKD